MSAVRTNIDIDDELMRQAMAASDETTKKAVVEKALRLMISLKAQEGIKKLRGKVKWEGDLDAMREGRFLDWEPDTAQQRRRKKSVA
jgi:Arc/MetJ family transcription regulator